MGRIYGLIQRHSVHASTTSTAIHNTVLSIDRGIPGDNACSYPTACPWPHPCPHPPACSCQCSIVSILSFICKCGSNSYGKEQTSRQVFSVSCENVTHTLLLN